ADPTGGREHGDHLGRGLDEPGVSDVVATGPAPRMLSVVLGSPALRLIGRRLLTAVPILLGVSILMFVLLNLIPGSAAVQLLGPEATPDQIARLEQQMGLNRPPVELFLVMRRPPRSALLPCTTVFR